MTNLLLLPLFMLSLTDTEEQVDSIKNSVDLQEVSVVASIKENGSIRQQPAQVSLIGSKQMAENHVTSLKGISGLVPNLFIPDYGSRLTSAIYIRGIGSRINTPAVGLYVDNIPYVDKSAFDFNFYDIQNIRVLRGPQGTLYGHNTMGGLVHVYTRNPFDYEGTDVRLGYTTGDNHRRASLTHYHRVSNLFAFSASGYYEGSNGFFTNDLTGKQADGMQAGGGRVRAIYRPTERLSFDLTAGYDYTDERAYPYFYTGSLTDNEDYPALIGKISNNRESRYRRGMQNIGLNTQYEATTWKMNSVTSYQHIGDRMFMDQDFLEPDIYTLEQRQKINTLTQEFTFKNTHPERWEWISGANLMYQALNTQGPVNFYADGLRWLEGNINRMMPSMDRIMMLKGMGFTGINVNFRGEKLLMDGNYDTPTLGAALFHQSTYHFTRHFSASLGLRLDYEHQQMNYDSPANVMYGFSMPNANNDRMSVSLQDLESHILYQGKLKDDHFRLLPRVCMKYDFSPRSNIYASAAMGKRSGGYNLQMFSDLLQGAMRADMMQGVKDGVAGYLDKMVQGNPHMPQAIPDPDNAGSMISLSDYVRRLMNQNMPQTEAPTTSQVVFKPEYSANFELGTHLTLPSNTLAIDAAIFYTRIYDQQIARFAPSGLGRMMVNAGQSQSCGAEFSARWTPTEHLALTANYGYTHATFLKYDDGQGHDYAHKYVPFVPMHNMNVDAAYTWNLSHKHDKWCNVSHITLGANCTGNGRIYWTESNNASQSFYAQLGARISLLSPHYELTFWGQNLTDTRYNTFYFESASRGFEQHGKPLQVGLDLNLKF